MASKQGERCRTSLVIKERLIEIRDIVLLSGKARRGWKPLCMQVQREVGPFPAHPRRLAPIRPTVGAWKYLLRARKHTEHRSAHSKSQPRPPPPPLCPLPSLAGHASRAVAVGFLGRASAGWMPPPTAWRGRWVSPFPLIFTWLALAMLQGPGLDVLSRNLP